MEQLFNQLSETLLNNLNAGEQLKVAIGGENSQFVRFSQSKVRQSGLVDDANLSIVLINDDRTCSGSFTLTENIDIDEELSESLQILKYAIYLVILLIVVSVIVYIYFQSRRISSLKKETETAGKKFSDIEGNFIKKRMRDCTGKEMCIEWLHHLGVPINDIENFS